MIIGAQMLPDRASTSEEIEKQKVEMKLKWIECEQQKRRKKNTDRNKE